MSDKSGKVRRWHSSHPGPTRELREVVEARHYDALKAENERLKTQVGNSRIYAQNISDDRDHLRQLLSEAREALNLRKQHDEDCADSTEKFKPHEMCECGASVVKDLLTKLNKALGE